MTDATEMRLEFVAWTDHANCAKWYPQTQIVEDFVPCEIESVGWLLEETSEYIVLVSSLCKQDDTAARSLLIMKPLIRKRLPLNVQSRRGRG